MPNWRKITREDACTLSNNMHVYICYLHETFGTLVHESDPPINMRKYNFGCYTFQFTLFDDNKLLFFAYCFLYRRLVVAYIIPFV